MWKNGIKNIIFWCPLLTLVMCGPAPDSTVETQHSKNAVLRLSVLGDSVAAGLFANTTLGDAFHNRGYLQLLSHFYAISRLDGESPQFYSKVDERLSAPDDGALSGIRPYSMSQRLNQRTHQIIEMGRFAISGTQTHTLSTQIDALENTFQPTSKKDDVIVLHVGSNDWCNGVDESRFEENFRIQLERLATHYPHAKILVLPLTDIAKVLSLPDSLAHAGSLGPVEVQVSCSAMRKAEQLCLARDINFLTPAHEIKAQQQSIARYNNVIQNVVTRLNKKSHITQIKVARSYENASMLKPSFLGLDCFHPGKRGHEAIADMIWPELESLVTTTP